MATDSRRKSWFIDRLQSPRPSASRRSPPDPSQPTPENKTLFQAFEWHTPSQPPVPHETHSPSSHYARLNSILPSLSSLGITSLWLPPGCKANNPSGNGYDCYDLWDLGEFDQKWARSTKWGSREELADLIEVAQREKIDIIWDTVLNHKTAGDAKEEVWAVEVDAEDRRIETCEPKKIEAWLRYEFPGREREGMKYSGLTWHGEHFNGTDWDDRGQKNAIYKLIDDPATVPKPDMTSLPRRSSGFAKFAKSMGRKAGTPVERPGKGWAKDVDDTHGNYDYLMFSNIDHKHPEVREDLMRWGEWMLEEVGVQGFRLDAVQHFSFAFTRDWVQKLQESYKCKTDKSVFIVGEIWTGEVERITSWLDAVGSGAHAYDSPLVYNFSRISEDVRRGSRNADLRTITRGTLVDMRPDSAVTLVANHDTQPGQTSFTPMDARLKPLWYAFVLLREDGLPCVFWGDVYGTQGRKGEPPISSLTHPSRSRSILPDLILARKLFAYGEQKDYFDAMSCIGWTRASTPDRAGCAVIMSIETKGKGAYTQKKMSIGTPGEVWVDILGAEGQRAEATIDGKGNGVFPCKSGSVAVFIKKDSEHIASFPVSLDTDIYST